MDCSYLRSGIYMTILQVIMRKLTLVFIVLFGLALGDFYSLKAQMVINQTMTAEQYVNNVLLGEGVVATNVQLTGGLAQLGHMTNGGTFPIESGLVLSTDNASNPATCNWESGGSGISGEPDLLTVANSVPPMIGQSFSVSSVNDVCILEFDFQPAGDFVSFNYVFGSNEYLAWVNSTYNDIFAFFLSGPGITGPYAAPAGFPDGARWVHDST